MKMKVENEVRKVQAKGCQGLTGNEVEAKESSPEPRGQRVLATPSLTWGLHNSQTINFCCFKTSSLWYFVRSSRTMAHMNTI